MAEAWSLVSPHKNKNISGKIDNSSCIMLNKFEIRIAKKTAKIKIYSELMQLL